MGASRDCQQCYYEWWSLWGGEMLLDVWYNKTKWDQEVIVLHFTYTLWCHTCHKILSRLAGEAHSISGSLDRRWHKAVLFMPRPRPRQSSQVPITLSGDLWRCWMPWVCWWPRRSLFSVHRRSDEAVKYPTIPYCMGHDHPMGSLPTVSSNPHRHPTIDDSAADYALRDHFKDCRRYVFLLCFFTKTLFVLQRHRWSVVYLNFAALQESSLLFEIIVVKVPSHGFVRARYGSEYGSAPGVPGQRTRLTASKRVRKMRSTCCTIIKLRIFRWRIWNQGTKNKNWE